MSTWILPDHLSDILPAEAQRLESLRRRLVDLYRGYGYQLFQPPMLEYIEALRVQGADDLDHRSFKLIDPLSSRLLGLRPDITPQAARVDAQILKSDGVARLCYAAPVVHALPSGIHSSREQLQMGCELFGEAGLEADLEVQELALASLGAAGLQDVHLSLTHRGILRALQAQDPGLAGLLPEVLLALGSKDRTRLAGICGRATLRPETCQALDVLCTLYGPALGDRGVIARARASLPAWPLVAQALDRLEAIARSPLFAAHPGCRLSIDLADQRGWEYHNGVMFSMYTAGEADALVRGGRYDGMGEAFGRARAATGFSLSLRALLAAAEAAAGVSPRPASLPIAAPWSDAPGLREAIGALRQAGQAVCRLPDAQLASWPGQRLEQRNSQWVPVGIPDSSKDQQ